MSVDSASVVLALERSSAAMTTPQRWMILPTATYSVIVVAAVVVSGCCCCCCRCWYRGYGCCAVAGFLGSLVRRCRSGRPGWLGNPRCPNVSPAGVLLLRFLLSMPSSAILPVTPATVRFPALCGDQWAARCGGLDSVSTLSSLPTAWGSSCSCMMIGSPCTESFAS